MNFIDYITSIGGKINSKAFDLSEEDITKDLIHTQTLLYASKFKVLPSTLYVEYRRSRFKEFLQFLVDEGFEVMIIRSHCGRHTNDTLAMIHEDKQIMLEISSNEEDEDGEADEDDESVSSVVLAFNPMHDSELVYKIKDKFFNSKKDSKAILLFEKSQYGDFILTPHKVKNYNLDISENYNDDFLEVHEKIGGWVNDFSTRNNKLVLLHGDPGAGKTNYIKYLLNSNKDVKKIYIPPYFVQAMADPAFFPVIKQEKNSLLIIEDAEKILINREDSADNSIISILLNLCDGIMADILNFKIIATFNTDEDKIDSALKRKGRMFLKYKFGPLSNEKTVKLFDKIHGTTPPKARMTLAEIYNAENVFGAKKEEPRRIGFGV